MEIICKDQVFTLKNGSDVLLHTDANTPMIYVGYGEERVEMYRGNFKLEDHLLERRPLTLTSARVTEQGTELDLEGQLKLLVTEKEGAVTLTVAEKAEGINRFWLHVEAAEDEHVYGCGEQMSYFDLRGRHFPLWSSEPGVGRDKTTYVTWRSDVENGGAGGDYYNTNYPQPTYVSSRHYYLHMDTTAYGDFDFRNPRYHELQCWNVPGFIRIEAAPTFVELLEKLTAFLGRQPELPEWIYNGLIIGAQGGNERSFGIVDKSLEHGIKVSGLWCQDWCGKRVTSFGKRLQWDWHFHKEMLPAMIALIALTQVVQKLRDFKVSGGKLDDARKIDKQGITKKEMISILPACLRSSAIASVLGAMPGVGGGVAQFLCYNEVRRTSKHPEEFGKGCLEGIAAAESSNNAVVGSAMIPLLTLGIPGDGVTALLLGAFVLHGIQPGPTMFTKQGVMAYTIIIGCLVANILLAPFGLGMTRLVAKIVQVRYTYLAPVIIMFCFAGAFAATGNTKELIICAGILIFSYILTVLDIDNTPLMLGMILEDIMEQNFVTASMSYERNYSIFITRPISAVILIITVVLLVSMIRVNRRVAKLNEQQEAEMAAAHAEND
mgnify:CR=1 FL=1